LKDVHSGQLKEFDAKRGNGGADFEGAFIEGSGEGRDAAFAVDGGEGLQTAIGTAGNEAIGGVRQGGGLGAEDFEQLGWKRCQIAGGDQVPLGTTVGQGRFHTGEWTEARAKVGDYGVAEREIFGGVGHQRGAAGGMLDGGGNALRQGHAAHRQQRFILPHPSAVSTGQDVPGYAHVEMIPLRFLTSLGMKIRIALIAAAAVGSLSAETVASRTTLVVRADAKGGRLVRSVVVEPRAVSNTSVATEAPEETAPVGSMTELIDAISAKHEVEGSLVHSVIKAESNYNPNAISPKGAQGLMQLIPSTARRFGVANTFNPEQNIEGGVKYLKFLMELYHNDYVKVIAAYNAGEGAVAKYGGIPPYAETKNYVYAVGKNLVTARKSAAAKDAAKEAVKQAPAAADGSEQFRPIQTVVGPDGRVYYKTQ
jgi:soluble lytic murein transglycosylase-like protein